MIFIIIIKFRQMLNRFADKNTYISPIFLTPIKKQTNVNWIQQKSKGTELQEQLLKNYIQLQNFYLPFLKKVFQENKSKIQNLKTPQQLIVQSKQFEYKQNELKRRLQILQKENSAKENKIRQIISKNQILQYRLKNYNANQQIQLDYTNLLQDPKIKRVEALIKIKNQEVFFRLKCKSLNLLEEFQIAKNEIQSINKLQSQFDIFQNTLNLLKQKAKQLKAKDKQIIDLNFNYKIELQNRSDRIKFLIESNQMLKLNEKKLKEKNQQIKKEWNLNYQRLIIRQKKNQEKDNQIFRLNKLLQERDLNLLKTTNMSQNSVNMSQQQRKQLEMQIKDLKTTINSYNMEKNQLLERIEQKQNEIESNRIKERFNREQYQRVNREFIRWKQRYQGLQKEKQNKAKVLEIQNSKLVRELKKIQSQLQMTKQKLYQSQIQSEEIKKFNQRFANNLQKKQSQIKALLIKNSQLEDMKNKKIIQIEQNYISKYNQLQKLRDQHIAQILIQKQQEYRQRIQTINQIWQKKIEQLQKKFNAKYNSQLSTQTRTSQQFEKLQQQNRHLNQRLNQNEKLLATLYPNIIKVIKSGAQFVSRKYDINKFSKIDQSNYSNEITLNLKTPSTPNNSKNHNFSIYSSNSNAESPDSKMLLKILKK